jgi:hypothetical protein
MNANLCNTLITKSMDSWSCLNTMNTNYLNLACDTLKIKHDKHFEFVTTRMNTMNWCLLLACKTLDSKHYEPMKTNNNEWVLNLEDHKQINICNNSNSKLKRPWPNDFLSLESCEVGCTKSMNINNSLFFYIWRKVQTTLRFGLPRAKTLKQCTFIGFWSFKKTLNHKKHELQSSNRMSIDESRSSKTFTKCTQPSNATTPY